MGERSLILPLVVIDFPGPICSPLASTPWYLQMPCWNTPQPLYVLFQTNILWCMSVPRGMSAARGFGFSAMGNAVVGHHVQSQHHRSIALVMSSPEGKCVC